MGDNGVPTPMSLLLETVWWQIAMGLLPAQATQILVARSGWFVTVVQNRSSIWKSFTSKSHAITGLRHLRAPSSLFSAQKETREDRQPHFMCLLVLLISRLVCQVLFDTYDSWLEKWKGLNLVNTSPLNQNSELFSRSALRHHRLWRIYGHSSTVIATCWLR